MTGSAARDLARAWQEHQQGRAARAEKDYRRVLDAEPDNVDAWCYLGIACHDQGRLDEAVAAYRRALRIRPHQPVALNNLGNTLMAQGRFEEALACFDDALRLKPGYANAFGNKGTALYWSGRIEDSVECHRQALVHAPDDARLHTNLGMILLALGRFEEGWREYAWRCRTRAVRLPDTDRPMWDGAPLDGRTILLTAEQGLGDTIHFVRYGAVLKQRYDCRVIAQCPAALHPLLATCPGIDEWVGRVEDETPYDVFSPMLSVPAVLGETAGTLPGETPYLYADPALAARWRARLASEPGFKVGVVWQGNPQARGDARRSFALSELAPLGKLHGLRLFSLQKKDGLEQLRVPPSPLDIVPLGEDLDETTAPFVETAAVIENLDLVITCDTAVAHLAGALGARVWLALAHPPDWRWGFEGTRTPWYPTMRLFRQPIVGDWPAVFRAMAQGLIDQEPGIRRRAPEEYRVLDRGRHRLVRARHGLVTFDRSDIYVGRSIERYGEYSEGEVEIFRQVLRPGAVVVEAGANIGAHTLPIARMVGEEGLVHAFEPQSGIHRLLCANVALNARANVRCHHEALGAAPGWIHVPLPHAAAESNPGGVELGHRSSGERVRVSTVDELGLARCDLIKVDVEGMELEVLRGAQHTIRAHRPALYVENDRRDRSPALIAHILSAGYRLHWHTPPLFRCDNFFGNPENVFGQIVSVNMLCVHESVSASLRGFRAIESPDAWWQPG